MSMSRCILIACIIAVGIVLPAAGQESAISVSVPRLINYSGVAKDANGNPLSGTQGVIFALYKDEQGGAALWLETQNVQADAEGHYSALLGASKPDGLPLDVFSSGEARWLEVQVQSQPEQPRVLLLSVPYAMKAGDAATVGGLPPSAFVLAAPAVGTAANVSSPVSSSVSSSSVAPPPLAGSGTLNFVPLWTPDGNTLGNSVVFQAGSGATAKIGINSTTPSTTLDVRGSSTIRGLLALPATGTATATAGKNSQAVKMTASAFNSGTNTPVNQNFQWQAEAANNNTSSASGTLNLLYSSGSGTLSETGLKISSKGLFTFADGQTFPGAGTITGITPGTALTGGGTSGNITLNVDTTQIPQLNIGNTFTGNQTVNGNLSATGVVTGSSYQIGSALFAFGSTNTANAFLGFAGNATMTGSSDTATGVGALGLNTTGSFNTATGINALSANTGGNSNTAHGSAALESNTSGSFNTADGSGALISNTTGSSNTASGLNALGANTTGGNNTGEGYGALTYNTTGSNNTALGYLAGPDQSQPNLTNATAIGALADVTLSNSLVLGSINGVNGATVDTNVGIGTTAPAAKLDVRGNANFTGLITFAAGQTFPGTGTITAVNPGTALSGGGSSGSVTLNVDTTKVVTAVNAGTDLIGGGTGGVQTLSLDTSKVPLLAAANTFTNNQTVSGNLTATGVVSGSSYQIGSSLFAYGSSTNANAFLGFAGNGTATGTSNTAVGPAALFLNTGTNNTATGASALWFNHSGNNNTAHGMNGLFWESGGSNNTASGVSALYYVDTGSNNTGVGYNAGVPLDITFIETSNNTFLGASAAPSTGTLSNITVIGANALATASNSLVLGSINGVNGATADTSVGIGTTAPASTLDLEANAAAGSGPILLFKNKAAIASGTTGNAIDLRFAPDGGSSVVNPNAYIRVREDGNSQYGAFMSFATMADGGAGTGPVERMRIRSDGFVGIGTTVPDALLSVNGGADKVGGGSWATFSDGRLKNLHGTFNAGLSEILKLQPIRYSYKKENALGIQDHDEHVGFVAQDVQKVIPEAVTQNDKGYLLVNNDPILWTMLNAIKEQQREIAQLRAQLKKKAIRQANLEARLSRLERNEQVGRSNAVLANRQISGSRQR